MLCASNPAHIWPGHGNLAGFFFTLDNSINRNKNELHIQMDKEKIKEYMIDLYGIAIFISSLSMILIVLGLVVISVIYLTQSEVVNAVVSTLLAGLLLSYSIILMKQIAIDRGP